MTPSSCVLNVCVCVCVCTHLRNFILAGENILALCHSNVANSPKESCLREADTLVLQPPACTKAGGDVLHWNGCSVNGSPMLETLPSSSNLLPKVAHVNTKTLLRRDTAALDGLLMSTQCVKPSGRGGQQKRQARRKKERADRIQHLRVLESLMSELLKDGHLCAKLERVLSSHTAADCENVDSNGRNANATSSPSPSPCPGQHQTTLSIRSDDATRRHTAFLVSAYPPQSGQQPSRSTTRGKTVCSRKIKELSKPKHGRFIRPNPNSEEPSTKTLSHPVAPNAADTVPLWAYLHQDHVALYVTHKKGNEKRKEVKSKQSAGKEGHQVLPWSRLIQ